MVDHPGRRCATQDLSSGDLARMVELERQFTATTRITESALTLQIPVFFIHVTAGAEGAITQAQREAQVKVLNDAYVRTGISFTYREDQVTSVDDAAFFSMGHLSLAERQCKTATQATSPELGLNFYTARPAGDLLGWATFPHQMAGDPQMDGVVMHDGTLPQGSFAPYNLGKTAVHEVGHWLGLYHTFQGGCMAPGDDVSDTPAHAGPNYGTPADDAQPHNLCPDAPAGALCPIHNFMNYANDDWMTEFTPGQAARIKAQVAMFRRKLLAPRRTEGVGTEAAGAGAAFPAALGRAVVW